MDLDRDCDDDAVKASLCEGRIGACWCLLCSSSGPWKPERALYLMFKLQMPQQLKMRGLAPKEWPLLGYEEDGSGACGISQNRQIFTSFLLSRLYFCCNLDGGFDSGFTVQVPRKGGVTHYGPCVHGQRKLGE